jgi:hypothetical protein
MRRPLVIRAIAVAIVVVLGIAAFALSRLRPANLPAAAHSDLAAPLPPESEADFAAALPIINEIRAQNGSMLTEAWLASDARDGTGTVNAYIEFLRREARRLENQAADSEDRNDFSAADDLRTAVGRLRDQARKLHEGELSDNTIILDYERR